LTLDPISLGAVTAVEFTSPTVKDPDDRPISAMEVGAEGPIYVASAYDPGDDEGPFSSSVWLAGWVQSGADGPTVVVAPEPKHIATLDGSKVESLAFAVGEDGSSHLFVGTDDEDFGGVLRPLPDD
jgi:hypothetical protein